jgi:osmoprotectant transport system substrate-binding protein
MLMRRFAALAITLSMAAVLLASCAPTGSSGPKPTVRIGSAAFGENVVLGELYAQVLEANGYTVERRLNLGSREIIAPALETSQIDMYPEYLATYLTFVTKDPSKASGDVAAMTRALQDSLKAKNITALDVAPAVDTNAFVMTKARADRDSIKKVSDLARFNNQLVLGGPPECPQRPFCQPGLQSTYGVTMKEFKALDSGGPLTVAALESNQVDVALLFSTNAQIAVKNFVVLEDDKKLQSADNVVPVVRNDLLDKAGSDFKPLVNGVSSKLTTEELTGLNRAVDVDRKDPKDAARDWLKAKQLVK